MDDEILKALQQEGARDGSGRANPTVSPLDLVGSGGLVRALLRRLGGKAMKEGADEMSSRDTQDAQAYEQDYHQRKEDSYLDDYIPNDEDLLRDIDPEHDPFEAEVNDHYEKRGLEFRDNDNMSDYYSPDEDGPINMLSMQKTSNGQGALLEQLLQRMRGAASNTNKLGVVK